MIKKKFCLNLRNSFFCGSILLLSFFFNSTLLAQDEYVSTNDIVKQIEKILVESKSLYLCLNRNYINIDNSYIDPTLSDNFCLAITQWSKKSLPDYNIIDMSLDYVEYGDYFTWAVPDRHYFITKK